MSSGQIFLVLGALILLSFNSINMNRAYVVSVKDSVEIQRELEAVQFGQYVAELMYSYSTTIYDPTITDIEQSFMERYGNCTDKTDPCINLEEFIDAEFSLVTNMNLVATVDLESDSDADLMAIITIHEKLDDDEYIQRLQLKTPITFINLGTE